MTGERPPLGNGTVRIETQIDAFTPNIRASMYLNFGDKQFEQQVIDYMRRTGDRPNVTLQRNDSPGNYTKLFGFNLFVNDAPGSAPSAPAAPAGYEPGPQGESNGTPF